MIEPLSVDTSGLNAAAGVLDDLEVPTPPGPCGVAGADAMTAAINEVLPIIEAPVIDGLPTAASALKRTASDMAAAADMYDMTDKASAGAIAQSQFAGEGPKARKQSSSAAAKAETVPPTVSAAEPLAGQLASLAGNLPSAEQSVQQLGQMAPMMGSATQSMSGQVQGLMSKAQGGGQNPAAPPAPDTTVEDPEDAEEQKADEQQKPADGAASGRGDGPGVPIPDTVPPTTTPSPSAAQGTVE